MELSNRQHQILIHLLTGVTSIPELLALSDFSDVSERTLQRDLNSLVELGCVSTEGKARARTYSVTPHARTNLALSTKQLDAYFSNENRPNLSYDFDRLTTLNEQSLFTTEEATVLDRYNSVFKSKLAVASPGLVRREHERITVELSWKSSQFEGNTYSLLETETLLREGIPAKGKTQEETTMVLNHKRALDFASEHKELFSSKIEKTSIIELHNYLAKNLFDSGIREYGVGITGSVYRPLDNKFQLEEELEHFCKVINGKGSYYDKALLAFTYLCYLQAFNDGNKRTGRILANAILYSVDAFPLSLRAVEVETYKLAILAFYELGTLGNAKQVFLDQAKFAAENYAI